VLRQVFEEVSPMDVYLMQHGEAWPEQANPDRPLTDAGRATVERVARRAAGPGLRPDGIRHSGIPRARQSAEILATQLGAEGQVREEPGLRPQDPVAPVAERLLRQAGEDTAVALVGHLPFLERLASRLPAGDEAAEVLAFRVGGLVKLVPKRQPAGFAVAWVLAPELA
jgi:phosphohistidine phosphatase